MRHKTTQAKHAPAALVLVWVLSICAIAAITEAQLPCGYEVTAVIQGPWCPIFGFPPTTGRAVTEDGAVVGHYTSCVIGPSEAFYWSESTGFVTLDRPPGYTSAAAQDIDSESGWIVGAMDTAATDGPFAALWPAWWAEPIDLGTLAGGNHSQARATDGLKIVGKWGNNIIGPTHGFLYENRLMDDLGPVLQAHTSHAEDIAASGAIVGWVRENRGDEPIAYLLEDDVATILGPIPGGFRSEAKAISPDGSTIVGVGRLIDRRTGDWFIHPFVWAGGQMSDIGTLPGFAWGSAADVNDAQVVIGTATEGGGSDATGFVWRGGAMAELNDLLPLEAGVHIGGAFAINQLGQITCRATDDDGDVVAVLLTPSESPLGDLNNDCHVGIIDLLTLLASWGPCDRCAADIDDDGIVGILDLLALLANWG